MEPTKDRRGISETGMTPRKYFEVQISRIISAHPEKVAILKQRALEAKNLLEIEKELRGQAETFIAFVTTMSEIDIIERRKWSSAVEIQGLVEAIGHYKFGADE